MERNYIPAAREEVEAIQVDGARVAELRMELIEEMNGLGPIDPLEPRCKQCRATDNLRDSEECWFCFDQKKAAGREEAYFDRAMRDREVA